MAAENTVKLLWDCAKSLKAETHTNKLLKSYYINTCRKIARNNLQMPKEKFAISQMCPRCSSFWSESEFRLKLKPQKVGNSEKAKKLIAKLDKAVNGERSVGLNKKQRRRAKWLKKRVCSSLELRCENCKKKSQIQLLKPAKRDKVETAAVEVVQEEIPAKKVKKKKKKKKDPTAGLKIAIKPTTTGPAITKPTTKNSLAEGEKQKKAVTINQVAETSTSKLVAKQKPSSQAATLKALHTVDPSGSVKKKKKKKNKSTARTLVAPTVQSKTQKNNTVLQLAALLKKQGTRSDAAKSRLELLLKES